MKNLLPFFLFTWLGRSQMLNKTTNKFWPRSPIPFKHVSFSCPFLDPHVTCWLKYCRCPIKVSDKLRLFWNLTLVSISLQLDINSSDNYTCSMSYLHWYIKGHFTHEPRAVTMKLWEPKRKCPKAIPRHLQNHVVWARIFKCSVKSYMTGPSTKCYFNEFLYMPVVTHDKIE